MKQILTIRAKLLLLFLILSFSFSTLVLFSLREIQRLGMGAEEILKAATTHGIAERLKARIAELSVVASSYLSGEPAREEHIHLALEATTRLTNNLRTTTDPALLKEAVELLARLSLLDGQLREWEKTKTTDLRTTITLGLFQLSEKVDTFWTSTRATLDLKISESNRLRERAVITVSIPSAFLLIVVLVATLLLGRQISQPLTLLSESVQAMREGRFDPASAKFKSSDEIGNLGRAFVQMATEIKRSQAELIQTARLTTVGTLASGVAHEISNPLQAISGNMETIEMILKDGSGSKEEIVEILRETRHAAERAKEIVQGLLRFARPTPAETRELFNPVGAIEEAFRLTQTDLDRQGVVVERWIPRSVPKIQGNSRELMQVFVNLITNAMRAMDASEEKKLKISVETKEGQIFFTFEDTGHGIPEEILPRIFEPFFTTSYKDADGRMKGTGLGLSICQRIVEEHKGKIEVRSKPEKGATFTVVLPVS